METIQIVKYVRLVRHGVLTFDNLFEIIKSSNKLITSVQLKYIDANYDDEDLIEYLLEKILEDRKYLEIIDFEDNSSEQMHNTINLVSMFGLTNLLKKYIQGSNGIRLSDYDLINIAGGGHYECIEFISKEYSDVYYIGENMLEGVLGGTGTGTGTGTGNLKSLKLIYNVMKNRNPEFKIKNDLVPGMIFNGHIECLKFVMNKGGEYNNICFWYALKQKNPYMLEYINCSNCPRELNEENEETHLAIKYIIIQDLDFNLYVLLSYINFDKTELLFESIKEKAVKCVRIAVNMIKHNEISDMIKSQLLYVASETKNIDILDLIINKFFVI